MGNYTIKSGDTGYRIAKNAGITFEELQKYNPSISDWAKIQPGQTVSLGDGRNTNNQVNVPEKVKPGAYYLSYPSHKISSDGSRWIPKGEYAVGHGGVVIVGEDGSVTQYDYGRYDTNNVIGTRNEKLQGNWTKTNRNPIDVSNTDYAQLLEYVQDQGHGASPNVRLTYAHNADPQKVIEYIENDANRVDRDMYGLPFSDAKREQFRNSGEGFFHRAKELCTTKGCAQSAFDAIEAGVPTKNKILGAINRVKNSSPINKAVTYIKELVNPDNDGVLAEFSASPRNRERRLQYQGYKTYDSNDYIDYD